MMRAIVRVLVGLLLLTSARTALAQRELLTTMGAKHTLAIDQIAGFRISASGFAYAGPIGFMRQSYTETAFNNNGDTTVRATTFWLAPSADYFVIDHLSIGGLIGVETQSSSVERPINGAATQTFDQPTTTSFTLLPRIGYLFAISDRFGIWPRAGLGFVSRQLTDSDPTDPAVTSKTTTSGFLIDLDVGFLYRPVEPVFLRLGPELATTLGASHSRTNRGVTQSANAGVLQFGVLGGVGVFLDL